MAEWISASQLVNSPADRPSAEGSMKTTFMVIAASRARRGRGKPDYRRSADAGKLGGAPGLELVGLIHALLDDVLNNGDGGPVMQHEPLAAVALRLPGLGDQIQQITVRHAGDVITVGAFQTHCGVKTYVIHDRVNSFSSFSL